MKIGLEKVENPGVLEQERVVLRVKEDADLGDYAVLSCYKASDDGRPISGSFDLGYWFNLFPVKAGDMVVLYTKDGTTRQKDIGNGKTSHFFYWGCGYPLWDATKTPVLLEAPNWQFFEDDEATREPEENPKTA